MYVCFTLFNKLSPGSLKDGCSASCHISGEAASLQRTVMSVVMAINWIGCVCHTLFRTFMVKPLLFVWLCFCYIVSSCKFVSLCCELVKDNALFLFYFSSGRVYH